MLKDGGRLYPLHYKEKTIRTLPDKLTLCGDGHWAVHQSASTLYFIFEVEVKADSETIVTFNHIKHVYPFW